MDDRAPYLNVSSNGAVCRLESDSGCCRMAYGFYCDLPAETYQKLQSVKLTRNFRRGNCLFVEGYPADTVFVIRKGRVKLSVSSSDGKMLIVGIAKPGDLLGITSILMGQEYEVSAEAFEPCQADIFRMEEFNGLAGTDAHLAMAIAKQVSRQCSRAYDHCSLGLADSILQKLATLIVNWCDDAELSGPKVLTNVFTHEEIAEMLGTSRETVTRAIGELRESGLVTLKDHTLTVHDLPGIAAKACRRNSRRTA